MTQPIAGLTPRDKAQIEALFAELVDLSGNVGGTTASVRREAMDENILNDDLLPYILDLLSQNQQGTLPSNGVWEVVTVTAGTTEVKIGPFDTPPRGFSRVFCNFDMPSFDGLVSFRLTQSINGGGWLPLAGALANYDNIIAIGDTTAYLPAHTTPMLVGTVAGGLNNVEIRLEVFTSEPGIIIYYPTLSAECFPESQ